MFFAETWTKNACPSLKQAFQFIKRRRIEARSLPRSTFLVCDRDVDAGAIKWIRPCPFRFISVTFFNFVERILGDKKGHIPVLRGVFRISRLHPFTFFISKEACFVSWMSELIVSQDSQ
jgi:hypothetical protein